MKHSFAVPHFTEEFNASISEFIDGSMVHLQKSWEAPIWTSPIPLDPDASCNCSGRSSRTGTKEDPAPRSDCRCTPKHRSLVQCSILERDKCNQRHTNKEAEASIYSSLYKNQGGPLIVSAVDQSPSRPGGSDWVNLI